MKALLVTLTTCLLIVSTATAKYSGGTGEPNDPYRIATAADLIALGETPEDYDKHFILTADIDLDPNLPGRKIFDWAIIAPGWRPLSFSGIFDGNGHTISHLTIKGQDDDLGLFGRMDDKSMVKDLGVLHVNISGSRSGVGGLVGGNVGTVIGCYSTGVVGGDHRVGGLVGSNDGGSIATSYSTASVSGTSSVGGLVGSNGGSIANSYSSSSVSGTWYVGGLVGSNGGSIANSYSSSSVSGTWYVGGLAGDNQGGTIATSYSTGLVSGSEDVGGLIGHSSSYSFKFPPPPPPRLVFDCFWDTQTSGQASSADGTGKTTAEMQMASTFLDAGWDFVGATANGTEDIWKISEGLGYPRLSWQKYSGGTGEPNDPYQISTAADLIALGETPADYDKHFILTADIDLDPNLPGRKVFDKAVIAPEANDTNWGFDGTAFTGVFDGAGHAISHLTVRGSNYLGLFGQLGSAASILGLGLDAVDVSGTGWCVGGLVGSNYGSIAASYGNGSVGGASGVGGLVGENWPYGSVVASYSSASVNGTLYVGGLVGTNCGSISASYSHASVSGTSSVGGLVGSNYIMDVGAGRVTHCYSTGSVSGEGNVGGLVGFNGMGGNRGTINSSFWDTEGSGQGGYSWEAGKTTAEMQEIETFLSAGWDFVGEVRNGTCDYWQISPGDYPRLRYVAGDRPGMPEGSGTAEQPYLIRNARDLGIVWFEPMAHYRLGEPVDLSGMTWSVAVIPWFGGSFDGNGYVLSNLHVQGVEYLGLFGELGSTASVSNLRLEAVQVSGTGGSVGGLAGYNGGRVVSSDSNGSVSGTEHDIGGLVGYNAGRVAECHSECVVAGSDYVGGLVGSNVGALTQCYTNGSVRGDWSAGGLVGQNYGSIAASYSNGSVSEAPTGGGLVGYNAGSIATSYSTGSVSGTGWYVGGLVGDNDARGNVSTSFWDMDTSGQAMKTWSEGEGKTTAEMQRAKTFLDAGWDFVGETDNGTEDIWWINEGKDYPRLWWEVGDGASP